MLPSGEIAAGHGKLSTGRRLSGAAITNLTTRLGGGAGFRSAANAIAASATAASAIVMGSRSLFFHDVFVAASGRCSIESPVVVSAPLPSSASANSCADENLSAGSFSSACCTASSTCSGIAARPLRIVRGFSVSIRAMIACDVLPVCGGSPVSISYVDRAERVDVAPAVDDAVASRLLGTHVLRSAERQSRLRDAVAARFAHGERDSEVGDHRLAGLEQNVLGLEVAVDYAVRVRVLERIGDLLRDSYRFVDGKLFLAFEPGAERFTLDVRHDVEQESVGCSGIEQRKKIRVLKICGDSDLGQKAFYAEYRAQLGIEELEGDVAVVADVAGEVDGRHSAGADLPLYVVAFGEGLLELRDRVHESPLVSRHDMGLWCRTQ